MPIPSFFPQQILTDAAFWRDSQVVARMLEDLFDRALIRLDAERGFIGSAKLADLLSSEIGDPRQEEALFNFLINVPGWQKSSGDLPSEFARSLTGVMRKPKSDGATALTDSDLATLEARIQRIALPRPGLDKQRKAESLVRSTGARLDKLTLITDLRPVFDDEAAVVEAMLPMTTLRIAYTIGNNQFVAEVRMSESEVADLCKKADRAKKKSETLKGMLEDHKITVPDSPISSADSEDE